MIGLRRGLVRGSRITALGTFVPDRVVTNFDMGEDRRHVGRVDSHPHGHPGATP